MAIIGKLPVLIRQRACVKPFVKDDTLKYKRRAFAADLRTVQYEACARKHGVTIRLSAFYRNVLINGNSFNRINSAGRVKVKINITDENGIAVLCAIQCFFKF